MTTRPTQSSEFIDRVALEEISGLKTIQEIAADHAVHPIPVSQWKQQLLEPLIERLPAGSASGMRTRHRNYG